MTGKEKCYELKRLREKIAKDNDIEGFEFKECNFDGECEGHCPACDAEAIELKKLIKKKEMAKIENNIKKEENNDSDFYPTKIEGKTKGIVLPPDRHKWEKEEIKQNPNTNSTPLDTMGLILPPEKGKIKIQDETNKDVFEDKNKKPRGIFKLFKNKKDKFPEMTRGVAVPPEMHKEMKEKLKKEKREKRFIEKIEKKKQKEKRRRFKNNIKNKKGSFKTNEKDSLAIKIKIGDELVNGKYDAENKIIELENGGFIRISQNQQQNYSNSGQQNNSELEETKEIKKSLPIMKVRVGDQVFSGEYDAEKEIVTLKDGRVIRVPKALQQKPNKFSATEEKIEKNSELMGLVDIGHEGKIRIPEEKDKEIFEDKNEKSCGILKSTKKEDNDKK